MSRKKSDPELYLSDSDESDDSDDSDDEDLTQDDLRFYPICCHTTSDVSASHPTLADAVAFDVQNSRFDLLQHLPPPSSDQFFEKAIICINKSRAFVSSTVKAEGVVVDGSAPVIDKEDLGKKLTEHLSATCSNGDNVGEDEEEFFRPFLMDDAFLLCMDDLEDLMEQKNMPVSSDQKGICADKESKATGSTNEELQMQIAALQEQLAQAKACITSLAVETAEPVKQTKPAPEDNDTYYFGSYSHSSIHEVMLKDKVRTIAYRDAILSNAEVLFKDKVVIDLGCGTGILSLFAAKAGAKKVIAIDASDVYKEATEIVRLNGYSDIITVVHGKAEDLIAQEKLPLEKGEKANVIISEWMGYALFFETMLPSVLTLRDAYMDKRKGMGTMFPNGCSIFLEGASDSRLDFWDDVYEMNMYPMKARVAKELKKDAEVEIVEPEKVVTNRIILKSWNLNECPDKELDFVVPFELTLREGMGDSFRLDKLVISFDIAFDHPNTIPVYFSTGCQSEPTHWKQSVLWIDPANGSPFLKKGEVMKGSFQMGRNNTRHRDMEFFIIWEIGTFRLNGDEKTFERRCNGTIVNSLKA